MFSVVTSTSIFLFPIEFKFYAVLFLCLFDNVICWYIVLRFLPSFCHLLIISFLSLASVIFLIYGPYYMRHIICAVLYGPYVMGCIWCFCLFLYPRTHVLFYLHTITYVPTFTISCIIRGFNPFLVIQCNVSYFPLGPLSISVLLLSSSWFLIFPIYIYIW